jgi:hypothetical protein
MSIFGNWITDTKIFDKLSEDFENAEPFPYIIIPNFFNDEVAEHIHNIFPNPKGSSSMEWQKQGWHVYDNPIEGKLAMDNLDKMGEIDEILIKMWDELESKFLINKISEITSISNLEKDPHRHGAGLHYYPTKGKLEMHLDYSIHPVTGKERRLNLLIYMNKDWQQEWNGNLELWKGTDKEMTTGPITNIMPLFNQAVIFRTTDISWHGMPKPLQCPIDVGRKSIAIYYVSNARADVTQRYKASFLPTPDNAIRNTYEFDGYMQLCNIRTIRRLEDTDIKTYMPLWKARWR